MTENSALYLVVFLFSAVCVLAFSKINKKIIGLDINKLSQPKLPRVGIALLVPFWALIILFSTWFFSIELLALGLMVSGFTIVGFLDETKEKFIHGAMPWLSRALVIAVVSLAFAWIMAPSAWWIIPVALFVAGLASFQNTFAGLNGWQAGSGFIIALSSGIMLSGTGLQFLSFGLAAIILGFLVWNKYPSKVLEGDSGTLFIGSAIAGIIALSGRIELMAFSLLFYAPHIIDFFFLKMLTNKKDPSQQKQRPYRLLKDGRLAIPEYTDGKERLDFAKLVMKIAGKPLKEWQIVLAIWIVVAVNAIFWLKIGGFV